MRVKRFIRFLVTGGVAAAVNVLSRLLVSHVMVYEVAVVFAYLVGMATAYVLARLFVFETSGGSVHSEVIRFTLVNLVALIQVWLVSVTLARYLLPAIGFVAHVETIGHIVGVLSPAVTSFYGHQLYTFARRSA